MPEFCAGTRPKGLDAFTLGYIECALWLGEQDGGPDFQWDDIADEALAVLKEDAREFAESFRALLDSANDLGRDDEKLGHDFYLTRNGHGSGFWDRDLGAIGDELSKMARPYGSRDLYRGDDNRVYVA